MSARICTFEWIPIADDPFTVLANLARQVVKPSIFSEQNIVGLNIEPKSEITFKT